MREMRSTANYLTTFVGGVIYTALALTAIKFTVWIWQQPW